MRQFSVVLTMLCIFFLSVLAAPLPSDRSLDKRQFYGRGTWFYDGVNESACGYYNKDNDAIVAISAQIFGTEEFCGRWVWISGNGVTTTARVADECEGCGASDLDMSIGLFTKFAELSDGELSIAWGWDS